MAARDKFAVGARVRLTAYAIQHGIHRRTPELQATVTSFARRNDRLVIVKLDTRKARVSYHMDFWEPIERVLPPRRPNNAPRPERAKLNEQAVRDIRKRWAQGVDSFKTLAKEYGVSDATVSQVVHRDTWRHVE